MEANIRQLKANLSGYVKKAAAARPEIAVTMVRNTLPGNR